MFKLKIEWKSITHILWKYTKQMIREYYWKQTWYRKKNIRFFFFCFSFTEIPFIFWFQIYCWFLQVDKLPDVVYYLWTDSNGCNSILKCICKTLNNVIMNLIYIINKWGKYTSQVFPQNIKTFGSMTWNRTGNHICS